MVKLCNTYLEPMRKKFGVARVLSGYRHEQYNRLIGGARHRQHIYEQGFESVAADMRFAKGTPAQWAAEAKRLRGSKGGGVGRYDRSGFVHVDNRALQGRLVGLMRRLWESWKRVLAAGRDRWRQGWQRRD